MSAGVAATERVREFLGRVLPRERVGVRRAPDGGPAALPEASPATLEEAVEVVRLARSERWTILPLGNGSRLDRAPFPRCDLLLSSRALAGLVAYEPADGTLTARAGTPWTELARATAARHHLSPELPSAAPATLGGVLGAGASGLDRLRYGPVRHQVLGLLALHADGSLVKSGGRVVKNVTGYDLHRLWCGSRGSLCFLLEATLRLYPAPAQVAVVRARCADLAEGLARSHALWRARLQPVAVVLVADAAGTELRVVLAGRAEAVASEVEGVRRILPAGEVLLGDEARRARAELGELAEGVAPSITFSCRPSLLGAALERLTRAGAELGLASRTIVHPLLASATLELAGAGDEGRAARLAAALAGTQASGRGLGPHTPAERVPAVAAQLMQRLKLSLDPDGVFVRAPFHGA